MSIEKLANITFYFIVNGLFIALFIYAIQQWGFCWQLFGIFPFASHLVFYKVQNETTPKKEDRFIFK